MLQERKEIVDWLQGVLGKKKLGKKEQQLLERLKYILEVAPGGLSYTVDKLVDALSTRCNSEALVFVEFPGDNIFQVSGIQHDTMDNLFDGTLGTGEAVVIKTRMWDNYTDCEFEGEGEGDE
jgi:hypothetical protein